MSGQVNIYRQSDASAPTLTGAAGSLLGLLNSCLVTGYGSKLAAGWTKPFADSSSQGCFKNNGGAAFTASISGTTMTVSAMTSGAIGLGMPISGVGVAAGTIVTAVPAGNAGQAGSYTVNISQTVSSESMNAGTLAIQSVFNGSISGTTLTVGTIVSGSLAIGQNLIGPGISAGTYITAGSGTSWTVNNSQTVASEQMYTAAYSGSGLATGFCLNVNDNGPGAATYKEARMTGFQTMSALATGTGQFPTSGQLAIGIGAVVCRKSATADSTARNWTLIADDSVFRLFIETGDNTAPILPTTFEFGDFFSTCPTDTSNCIIIGRTIENSASPCNNPSTQSQFYESYAQLSAFNQTILTNLLGGHFVAASFTNTGGSIAVGKHTDYAKMGLQSIGWWLQMGRLGANASGNAEQTWQTQFQYPNAPDFGLYTEKAFIHHNGCVRGYLKGVWCPLQHLPLNHDDTYAGTGSVMNGKQLVVQNLLGSNNVGGATAAQCQAHFEYSSTWK